MKKIFLGACALVAAMTVASCDNCKDGACATNDENIALSQSYGTYVGAMIGSDMNSVDPAEAPDKDKFLAGMQVVLGANGDRETRYGMQIALQLLSEMEQLDNNGIKMNKVEVINALRKSFMNDTLSRADVEAYAQQFHDMYVEAQENARKALEVQQAEAAQSSTDANVAAGNEYVEKLKADDPTIVTLPSGLSVKVIEPGKGDKPASTANVVVNYVGSHINGDVFDQNDNINFNLQGVVPGFREGLMQLGKGGKAILYIPGKLAYGANGAPQAGIGPNEMLVFNVELVDFD